MSEIKSIKVSTIDPKSTVNVRRTAVKENVEKIKASIKEYGYWLDYPITVRPHSNPASKYQYEYVRGQCRLKACIELKLEEIPAVIKELDDEQAIQQSWLENEARGDLTASDKTYWVEKIYKRYAGSGHTNKEALELAARYLGVTVQTARLYYMFVVIPEDLKERIDQKILPEKYARVIAKTTMDSLTRNDQKFRESQDRMRERADWIINLVRDHRDYATEALEVLGSKASIADLNNEVEKKISQEKRILKITIPEELHDQLLEWGKNRGLKDEETIISHMLAEILRKNQI